jgi:site-specific DNA recombinase
MTNKNKKVNAVAPIHTVRTAFAYARVSSKDQDKEGFSIPAQQKAIEAYARTAGIIIQKEFVDIETAKQSGRTNFEHMLRALQRSAHTRIILVEKTDRLYRNLKDWVRLDELEIEIHLVKEGVVLSRDSRSSEKFVHGIKVLMAKNYVDNLSEEASKGMLEKATQGIWPSKAPLGYLNLPGPHGKKIIDVDPVMGPLVSKLFGWYATGNFSLREITEKASEVGLRASRSGGPVTVSRVHAMLHNRLYTGEFQWKGRTYLGTHVPLVTRELWEEVQRVLRSRSEKKTRKGPRDFAFSRLISCGHCGCAVVGELRKGKYIYYHCSGHRGNCGEAYVREEVLAKRFTALLARLKIDGDALQWLGQALRESHADIRKEHEEAIARLQAEHDRLQQRIYAMYLDKLDGKIDRGFFDQMSEQWRVEQHRCLEEIAKHHVADQACLGEGVRLLELASKAQALFSRQSPSEQRRLLNFVFWNSTWKDGELHAAFRQPFDMIAETVAASGAEPVEKNANFALHPVWRPLRDLNPCSHRERVVS